MPQANLPFDRYLITLRLNDPVRFHLNHGGVIRGLMSAALGEHELPAGLIPFACESGRSRFDGGEPYHIGVTLAGEARSLAATLQPGLEAIGRSSSGPRPTLGGNFEVLAVQPVPPPNLDAMIQALAAIDNITLRFVSPLRLERPPALKTDRQRYLNAGCFPVDHFLRRLFQRLFMLEHGRYPDRRDRDRLSHLRRSSVTGNFIGANIVGGGITGTVTGTALSLFIQIVEQGGAPSFALWSIASSQGSATVPDSPTTFSGTLSGSVTTTSGSCSATDHRITFTKR